MCQIQFYEPFIFLGSLFFTSLSLYNPRGSLENKNLEIYSGLTHEIPDLHTLVI